MIRKELVRAQLQAGIPESWITDELVEAVALAIGNQFIQPAHELAEPRHGMALLKYAAKIEENAK